MANDDHDDVILVVGSCGMDHLLTTTNYPPPDSKVRSVSYAELGGGNAANTATAMSLLRDATLWTPPRGKNNNKIRIKLLSKVGDDPIGQRVVHELEGANVDVSSPLFRVCPGSTTSFTTIIVELENHTRTCIHTPDTCGELTIEDCCTSSSSADDNSMDRVFENVIHLHSDSRHADASLFLAREAKRRGIPVSVDCEKDRNSDALDALVELSDLVFTNSNCLRSYLERLERELEAKEGRMPLPVAQSPSVAVSDNFLMKDGVDIYLNSLGPSAFYSRWYSQTRKEVIVTHGDKGALHYKTISLTTTKPTSEDHISNKIAIASNNTAGGINIEQKVIESITGQIIQTTANYAVHEVGVINNTQIVDTTGAGDAFIGGYLMARYGTRGATEGIDNQTQFEMEFASWVSAKKLEGPGARSSLPKGIDVDTALGHNVIAAKRALSKSLSIFNETKKSSGCQQHCTRGTSLE